MGPVRFLAAFVIASALYSGLGGMTQALSVPLCPESFQVILIGDGGSISTPEPSLPPPLEDYSEVLNIDSGHSSPVLGLATPAAGRTQFPTEISEIIADVLVENEALFPREGDGTNLRVAAVLIAKTVPKVEACVVEVWDRQFRPRVTAVEEGTTVYWINRSQQNHRARPSGSGICNFDTGVLGPGEIDSHEFDEPADFPCTYEDPGFDRLHLSITVCPTASEEIVCR